MIKMYKKACVIKDAASSPAALKWGLSKNKINGVRAALGSGLVAAGLCCTIRQAPVLVSGLPQTKHPTMEVIRYGALDMCGKDNWKAGRENGSFEISTFGQNTGNKADAMRPKKVR